MLFAIRFLVTFLFGGLTGVIPPVPLDFHVPTHSWSRISITCCSAPSSSRRTRVYFWFPKYRALPGRAIDKLHFWLTFIGFHMTFLVQHWLGAEGMPRRYADYPPTASPP
jgi:cytochrome c oxidase subunit 1